MVFTRQPMMAIGINGKPIKVKRMNKTAKFWKYTGNHSGGKDCERKDSHGFGVELISAMAYWGNGGDYQQPLTSEDTKQIKVTHHKGDDFGHEVTVSAPAEIWEKGKQAYDLVKL